MGTRDWFVSEDSDALGRRVYYQAQPAAATRHYQAIRLELSSRITYNETNSVTPRSTEMTFRTERRVPRLGVMLVGWGGNNGTTVTAAVLANKLGLTWRTKNGEKASTVCLGSGLEGEVNVPFRDLLPMVHPNDIVFDGMENPRHSSHGFIAKT
ncbi:Inositol-3-phosphate synthase 1-A [Goodea atripinnis]|uniref:Inositol-3-phosphate synthase 1-A n=1 Tax=Goodea atripinnis TaxID=208336 RepID=A0ABV0NJ10_9TELE